MSPVTVIPSVSRACTWISLIEVKPSLVSVNVDAVSLFFTCLSSCGANIRPVRRWLLSIRAHIPLHARHVFILSMKLPLMTKIEFMRSHDSHLLWAKWNNMPLDMAQSKSCEVWLLQRWYGYVCSFPFFPRRAKEIDTTLTNLNKQRGIMCTLVSKQDRQRERKRVKRMSEVMLCSPLPFPALPRSSSWARKGYGGTSRLSVHGLG